MAASLVELEPADIERLVELEQLLFSEESPWSAKDFESAFALPHIRLLGLKEDDLLVGYAVMAELDPDFELYILGVDPAFQGRGLSRLLMDALLVEVDAKNSRMFLEVRTDNDVAISLYTSYGFQSAWVRKNYYQPSGADAYVMARPRRGVNS